MLANNLTLDDEEAVQEEFKELQARTVSFPTDRRGGVSLDAHILRFSGLSGRELLNSQTFQTWSPSASRLQVLYHSFALHGRSLT